jgi:hypothetical protein
LRRGVRRHARGACRTVLLAAALLFTVPAAALAQDPPRTDPEVGSPAEAVYGIPLEEARRDAAPRALPGTAIRTEQGVGSSARVPGSGDGTPADDPAVDPERVAERQRDRRREAARAATRISGEPSAVATATVLVLLVAVAAGGGVGAGRLVGPRSRL